MFVTFSTAATFDDFASDTDLLYLFSVAFTNVLAYVMILCEACACAYVCLCVAKVSTTIIQPFPVQRKL